MLLLESDQDPATLTERLDEQLPHKVDAQEWRRLELRRHARENREALAVLGGLRMPGG